MYQFPSDKSMSTSGATEPEWIFFTTNNTAAGDAQDHWNEDFSAAYIRLSLTGVYNINADIIECTDALPGGIGNGQAEPPVTGDFNFHGGFQPVPSVGNLTNGIIANATTPNAVPVSVESNVARRRRNNKRV